MRDDGVRVRSVLLAARDEDGSQMSDHQLRDDQGQCLGWNLRVGIHAGPVVAGVLGRRQYLYDLWGDTVNTAARLESHGKPGCVNLSTFAWRRVASHFRGELHGCVEVKGKGVMELIHLNAAEIPAP